MHNYIVPINKLLRENGNKEKAMGAKAYLRNQFAFYGVPMTERRNICKAYLKESLPSYEDLPEIMTELFNLPQRELQYFAIELLASFKKQWTEDIIALMEKLILTKSWWDTVDYIASAWTAPYFQRFPRQIGPVTGAWNQSNERWLQRSSLLFQLKYKQQTDTELLAKYIVHLSGSKEFFIQKAIGWILREYSKTDPKWVQQFVSSHRLAALSTREALKRIAS